MEEFLFELLLGLLQVLFEFFLEIAGEAIMDFAVRGIARFFEAPDFRNPWVATVVYISLGVLTGGLSLIFFPHPIIHPSRIHGISLVISPVLAGLIMSLIGSALRKRDKEAIQLESFRYGFAFALGMAAMRFLFTR
jgi:hypothetical protein